MKDLFHLREPQPKIHPPGQFRTPRPSLDRPEQGNSHRPKRSTDKGGVCHATSGLGLSIPYGDPLLVPAKNGAERSFAFLILTNDTVRCTSQTLFLFFSFFASCLIFKTRRRFQLLTFASSRLGEWTAARDRNAVAVSTPPFHAPPEAIIYQVRSSNIVFFGYCVPVFFFLSSDFRSSVVSRKQRRAQRVPRGVTCRRCIMAIRTTDNCGHTCLI